MFDIDSIIPMYKEMARNYFATKERIAHYTIYYPNVEYPLNDDILLHPFSDEEIASMKMLREKYGKNEFFKHLEEILDEETLEFIDSEYITDLNIDYPTYLYRFTYHEITDSGAIKHKLGIDLSDDTYIKLLELHLWDKDMNLNILKYADKNLYRILSYKIDDHFQSDPGLYCMTCPFAVTMDELKEDAQKIREQNPDKFPKNLGCNVYNPAIPYHSES